MAITEYVILIAFIAVLLIAVVAAFGSSIPSWFADRSSTVTTA